MAERLYIIHIVVCFTTKCMSISHAYKEHAVLNTLFMCWKDSANSSIYFVKAAIITKIAPNLVTKAIKH